MRLVLFALLIATMVGSAAAVDLSTKGASHPAYQQGTRTGVYCLGVNFDSAFYNQPDTVYGNVLDVGVGGPFSYLDFIHYGYGTPGPYNYNIRVYDPVTCTQVCSIGPLVAADAAAVPVEEILDVCSYGCNLTGQVLVGIEDLTCFFIGTPVPWDCYPDLVFDYDAETPSPAVSGCGAIVDMSVDPDECGYVTADGFPVDFLLGVYVDECEPPVATEPVTWGQVKGLYR